MKRKPNGPAFMRHLESLRWYRWGAREWIRRGRRGRNMFEEALNEATKEDHHGRPEQN